MKRDRQTGRQIKKQCWKGAWEKPALLYGASLCDPRWKHPKRKPSTQFLPSLSREKNIGLSSTGVSRCFAPGGWTLGALGTRRFDFGVLYAVGSSGSLELGFWTLEA